MLVGYILVVFLELVFLIWRIIKVVVILYKYVIIIKLYMNI